MIYLNHLDIPDQNTEIDIVMAEKRTCFSSAYPFKIFPQKQISSFDFAPITMLYGGNGSGKTTLLNVISEKLGAHRNSKFAGSPYFERYVDACSVQGKRARSVQFLSSDDVFDYIMNVRYMNDGIDRQREQLFADHAENKWRLQNEDRYTTLKGLDDYDNWYEKHELGKKSQSQLARERLARNVDMFSNGETALRYFTERIDRDAIYLIDEPENSLSVEYQLDLVKYISDSARFFECQFIIATHSPIFLSVKGAKIYDLDSTPACEKEWTELPNVRKYYEFFKEHEPDFIS
jgi:predicted ATPase